MPGADRTPAGTTDCHIHIIGPPERYPMNPARVYTPGQASVADLQAMRARTGIARNVLVQPSFYGTDNRCMLDALAELGDSARGVAVVDPHIPDQALRDLHAGGVRGLRLNLETGGDRDAQGAGARIAALAPRLPALGWHVQIYAALSVIAAAAQTIADSPVPVVIDHFGLAKADGGVGQPGFSALVELVRGGRAYVKLSAPHRISSAGPDHADAAPLARALIEAGPERMLWGSDWPHTVRTPGQNPSPLEVHPFLAVDDVRDLAAVRGWTGDEALARAILVDNPTRLYGFT